MHSSRGRSMTPTRMPAGGQMSDSTFLGVPGSSAASNDPPPLHISWRDGNWNPNLLTAENILEYFSNVNNPFYDKTCNNQTLMMQRRSLDFLEHLTGTQYVLVLAQPPLFVIRKELRSSRTDVSPLAFYYVIDGLVLQSPDLQSVVASRLAATLYHLRQAFETAKSYVKFDVSKGAYEWHFKDDQKKAPGDPATTTTTDAEDEPAPERTPSTLYQRTRVDQLLALLADQFPPPPPPPTTNDRPPTSTTTTTNSVVPTAGEAKEAEVAAVVDEEPNSKKARTK